MLCKGRILQHACQFLFKNFHFWENYRSSKKVQNSKLTNGNYVECIDNFKFYILSFIFRLNAERWRSFLAILLTDLASMLSSFAISRLLLLVPGLSSCEQIISWTAAMFSSVRAVLGLPLPGFRFTAEPVLWNRWQIAFTVHNFHPFSGYDDKIALYPLPCSHNVWIRILSSCETFPMFIQACSVLLRLGRVPYTAQLQHNHLSVLMMKLLQ